MMVCNRSRRLPIEDHKRLVTPRDLRRWLVVTGLAAAVLLSGCSQDPVKQALAGLRRGTAAQRRAAAEELGKMKDVRAVEPLILALQDPDDSVADAAAGALGRIADPRAIRPLAAALKKPATRWSAADALVGLGVPALDTVIAALNNPDVEVSKALLPHLKQHNVKDPRLVEPLVRQLRSNDWFVRHSAAESLGRIGDLRAVEPLAHALRDDNRIVREEVARVLGEMGDRRAVDALLIALRELDTAEAARALGKLGDPRALEPLAAAFHGDDIGMRSPAAEGLGLMRDPRALDVLLAEILNWELRTAVGNGLTAAHWKPSTEREQVYLWICQGNAAALARARAQTCRVLLEDVQSMDKPRIDHAVFALVSLGWEDMVPELKRILEENGHEEMAETYLNCGHDELRVAAKIWGNRHKYAITPYGGSRKTSWGAWR
jgi:HEAT repeat protein